MSRDELVNKGTDNIYSDIVDVLEAYTLEFQMEDEASIVDDVIAKMIEMYK
jgi:hypothetical protein